MTGMRSAIGETEFEMQQILGYAPIEPDGSFKLHVPADTPIALAVDRREGPRVPDPHQLDPGSPGERRTCDGCHSPRRGGALNSGAVVNSVPAALQPRWPARTSRARRWPHPHAPRPDALQLVADMLYTDDWADTAKASRPLVDHDQVHGNPNRPTTS
jgi:hypothetical protein